MTADNETFAIHSYVILAYRESPYLEACIQSLKAQEDASPIVLSTSTPSLFLSELAWHYQIRLEINPYSCGIASDWNFALNQAKTPWVTLAHQDDLYLPNYGVRIKHAIRSRHNGLLVFSNYYELTADGLRSKTLNLRIKSAILKVCYAFGGALVSCFSKRALLALGSPIPCPAAAYHRAIMGDFLFSEAYKVNLDWDAWLRLADLPGSFVYIRDRLMYHRIHELSQTSACIVKGVRSAEDLECFLRVWPSPLARLLAWLYRFSYRTNISR